MHLSEVTRILSSLEELNLSSFSLKYSSMHCSSKSWTFFNSSSVMKSSVETIKELNLEKHKCEIQDTFLTEESWTKFSKVGLKCNWYFGMTAQRCSWLSNWWLRLYMLLETAKLKQADNSSLLRRLSKCWVWPSFTANSRYWAGQWDVCKLLTAYLIRSLSHPGRFRVSAIYSRGAGIS